MKVDFKSRKLKRGMFPFVGGLFGDLQARGTQREQLMINRNFDIFRGLLRCVSDSSGFSRAKN